MQVDKTPAVSYDLPSQIDWEGFRRWLFKNFSRKYAGELYRVARRYYVVLSDPGEASRLLSMSDTQRRFVMASLSNLSKYLGVYRRWKGIIEDAGLKWSGGSSEDLIISRFTRAVDSEDVVKWVLRVKREIPDLSEFMDLAASTGLRFVEVVNSYSLIQKAWEEYYDAERKILEHYKYRSLFLRRSKKVFVSFVPEAVIERIREADPLTKSAVENRLKRRRIPSRFGDLREWWATYMTTRNLTQPEIDFLQGRVSTSVFMRHYFNPAWISDLQKRTLKATEEILRRIKGE